MMNYMPTFDAKLYLFNEADVPMEVTLSDLLPSPDEYGNGWILIAARSPEEAAEAGQDYADETARTARPVLKYLEILVATPK
jgi:hypothetical protein